MSNRPQTPFRMTPVVFHVLLALAQEDSHAYAIMRELPERTGGAIEIGPGSLHYTLGKLLDADLIEESDRRPGPEEDDPRRKYYRLTSRGREVLTAEASLLADIVDFASEQGLIPGRGRS